MNRPKRRLALVALVGLAAATVTAVGPSSPAGGQAPEGIHILDGAAGYEPVAGFSGHDPVPGAETAPAPTTNDGVELSLPQTESVIGPDGRVRVRNTRSGVAQRIGQLVVTNGGSSFICTGWLIDDNSILTSGHCAFDPFGAGGVESATWYPGRNGATDPHGGCAVSQLGVLDAWRYDAKPSADYAVMNLRTSGPDSCPDIGQELGTFGLMAFPGLNGLDRRQATVQGYPGDKPDGTQWKMNGRIDPRTSAALLFYPMDTFGGQSGSPVWWNRTTGACRGACGYGVHSYGVGISGINNRNSGPRLTAVRIGGIQVWAGINGG